jgi:hypothetical protein
VPDAAASFTSFRHERCDRRRIAFTRTLDLSVKSLRMCDERRHEESSGVGCEAGQGCSLTMVIVTDSDENGGGGVLPVDTPAFSIEYNRLIRSSDEEPVSSVGVPEGSAAWP